MNYDLVITAVTERSDLFITCTESLLAQLDLAPARLLVHEDVRPGTDPALRGRIYDWLRASDTPFVLRENEQPRGMGAGMAWAFELAHGVSDFVLYTQEDWKAVRPIPARACLELMRAHELHHVRFNKRKTMRAKHEDTDHPWHKVEVRFGAQVLCVSDHWYTQTSLWRVSAALSNLRRASDMPGAQAQERFVATFNRLMDEEAGLTTATWNDQRLRHERLRTYIWGGIGEPRFIEHAGTHRGTGTIRDHRGV
jgi:hypothetical protein